MPYPGQGTRVNISGIDGEWICEGQFFFANGDEPIGAPLTTSVATTANGERAHGIGVDVVAEQLHIPGNRLLEMNRAGDVTFKVSAPYAAGYPGTMFLYTLAGTVRVEIATDN